ncbi:peptidoglycan bridge formation glycyltransferase FemA/FemB family protein [Geomonas sp. RF6]|uniref:lipid II:glycine glycyltransferase FemX n=1 Tax=Geomonas sp. RF6 TaxID=2897342 RepID=UPI001E4D38B5|nr:peptidoglycan bridge formation glycyltransferase FemA/FemB family protein [Geomonas sp. RF6]UFS71085.1 peptidoglycan bridge formation glycyltransferase FemA/FemB family protein [Geomonas sp. RF6]
MNSAGAQRYSVETALLDRQEWDAIVSAFADANIYQTWSYESVLTGTKGMQHLLLRKEGEIVAAAQARLTKIPFTGTGIAYVRWGPLWRRRGKDTDPALFAAGVRALRREFVEKRGMILRILPLLFDDDAQLFQPALEREEFSHHSVEVPQRTLLIDLRRSPDALRKGLEQKWRNCLNRAEKNGLLLAEGTGDDLFSDFLEIYRETKERKKFLETTNVQQFRTVQATLPEEFKMRLFIAYNGEKPAAGLIVSGIGDTGVFLFGGTSDAGLTSKGSYLLQWKALNWLRENGSSWYNLAGINPLTNPGTYHFKIGLCGKNGKEVSSLGTYDACDGVVTAKVFRWANLARVLHRKGMVLVSQIRARYA